MLSDILFVFAIIFLGVRLINYQRASHYLIIIEAVSGIFFMLAMYFTLVPFYTITNLNSTSLNVPGSCIYDQNLLLLPNQTPQNFRIYYLQNTASNVIGYNALGASTPAVKVGNLFTLPGAGDFVIDQFLTNNNVPAFSYISNGKYQVHIHAAQTAGTRETTLSAQLWVENVTGHEYYLIGQTNPTDLLGGNEFEYTLNFTASSSFFAIPTTDRIGLWLIANSMGSGSNAGVTLYVGGSAAGIGTADAHIWLPTTNASVFDDRGELINDSVFPANTPSYIEEANEIIVCPPVNEIYSSNSISQTRTSAYPGFYMGFFVAIIYTIFILYQIIDDFRRIQLSAENDEEDRNENPYR